MDFIKHVSHDDVLPEFSFRLSFCSWKTSAIPDTLDQSGNFFWIFEKRRQPGVRRVFKSESLVQPILKSMVPFEGLFKPRQTLFTRSRPAALHCQARPKWGGRGRCWIPGGIDAQESHGPEAGLLRKFSDKFQQILSVVELAQVDPVSHGLPIGHDPHLEKTYTHTFL